MPNKNYVKGYRKERKIVLGEKAKDRIAVRTAGSHSPFDVISIDLKTMRIRLIQSKPDNYPRSRIEQLYIENTKLNGRFAVEFVVI